MNMRVIVSTVNHDAAVRSLQALQRTMTAAFDTLWSIGALGARS